MSRALCLSSAPRPLSRTPGPSIQPSAGVCWGVLQPFRAGPLLSRDPVSGVCPASLALSWAARTLTLLCEAFPWTEPLWSGAGLCVKHLSLPCHCPRASGHFSSGPFRCPRPWRRCRRPSAQGLGAQVGAGVLWRLLAVPAADLASRVSCAARCPLPAGVWRDPHSGFCALVRRPRRAARPPGCC